MNSKSRNDMNGGVEEVKVWVEHRCIMWWIMIRMALSRITKGHLSRWIGPVRRQSLFINQLQLPVSIHTQLAIPKLHCPSAKHFLSRSVVLSLPLTTLPASSPVVTMTTAALHHSWTIAAVTLSLSRPLFAPIAVLSRSVEGFSHAHFS